ncbi:MAG: hypothetical protein KTR31_36385 [Myxococcales bacterium]|nr:hypothetical protein [Myxococcales bacterium]
MIETAKLAGYLAAHALWSVSEGALLIPTLGSLGPDGSRKLVRFATNNVEDGVLQGQQTLVSNPEGLSRAVLIYDGYLPGEAGRTDALLIEAVAYGAAPERLQMGVPYRHAEHAEGFAVHQPTILELSDPQRTDAVHEAFREGVGSHEHGARLWSAHLG